MGSCVSSRSRSSQSPESSDDYTSGTHNRPLKARRPRWKSNIRLTMNQLQAKRDEFWDTAPAFEGRREIWDALKASVAAFEAGDHQMAQAIIDGANISLPNGTLMDCYDELGNRYQLPVYLLSAPINLITKEESCSICGGIGPVNPPTANAKTDICEETETGGEKPAIAAVIEIPIKVRLSTGRDHRIVVSTLESIRSIKKRVSKLEDGVLTADKMRIFFAGRQLHDQLKICEAKIERGYTLQCIVDETPTQLPAQERNHHKSDLLTTGQMGVSIFECKKVTGQEQYYIINNVVLGI